MPRLFFNFLIDCFTFLPYITLFFYFAGLLYMLGFQGVGLHGWVGYLSCWYIDGMDRNHKKNWGNISHFYFHIAME